MATRERMQPDEITRINYFATLCSPDFAKDVIHIYSL